MNPRLRIAIVMSVATALAVWLGILVAEESLFLPGLAAAIALAAIFSYVLRLPTDLILVGFALIGYLVGNRGFAQLTPPGLPLFPAEAVLMTGLAWRLVLWARERTLPFRRDALNVIVIAWLVVGTVRVAFDLPRFGMTAIRDYATVYYALFFPLVRHMVQHPNAERYLRGCLLAGLLALPPLYFFYQFFPAFFLDHLRFNGAPVIFYKGDLVHGFMVAGSVLLFFAYQGRARLWARPLAIILVLYVMPGDSRAAVVAALVVSGMMMLARRWRYPLWHMNSAIAAALVIAGLAIVGGNSWAEQKLQGTAGKLLSILDIESTINRHSDESAFKADNNRFRLVWWKNVAQETIQRNPVFGLGFGQDLAAGFVREYYPDASDEFNTRSPHNIFMTIFGRMGAIGVAIWTSLVVAIFLRTWRALQRNDERSFPLWSFCCVLLTTATFGVVLEGPMAAMPFWTVLGIVSAVEDRRNASTAETARLRTGAAGV